MRIPLIQGLIRRRILLNYRADPDVVQRILPEPFEPKLHAGKAIIGVCLIRLEHVRLGGFPAFLGIASENAAHRFAVVWEEQEGVYIPRRDTNSGFNRFAGGRLFPGEQNAAQFKVDDDGTKVDFRMASDDGLVSVSLRGTVAPCLPVSSVFDSLADASSFFEPGEVGYSVTKDEGRLDGLRLKTLEWQVSPLEVAEASSSYFEDPSRFPEGSVELDHALIMRNLRHEWHAITEQPKMLTALP